MADTKISEFASAVSVSAVDTFPIVQSALNKKATLGQIKTFSNTNSIANVVAGTIALPIVGVNIVTVTGTCILPTSVDATEVKVISLGSGKISSVGLLPSDGFSFAAAGATLNAIWAAGKWNVMSVSGMTTGIV